MKDPRALDHSPRVYLRRRPPGPLWVRGWWSYLTLILPRAVASAGRAGWREFKLAAWLGWKDPNT